ncbi:MAG: VanW family protein [Clostridia bacterium]|nr:VanW family protein [Clostridia bacterium]
MARTRRTERLNYSDEEKIPDARGMNGMPEQTVYVRHPEQVSHAHGNDQSGAAQNDRSVDYDYRPEKETVIYDEYEISRRLPEKRTVTASARGGEHRALWGAVAFFAFVLLCAMVLLMLPQLTGVRYKFIPNLAFVNGNIIVVDDDKADTFDRYMEYMTADTIYPGVYIDDVHVGGMTREQAVEAVEAAAEDGPGSEFDITVLIGNGSWHLTRANVPVSRNVRETVDQAWAIGRRNTAAAGGSDLTPFEERLDEALSIRGAPVSFTTELTYSREALMIQAEAICAYVNRDPVNSMVESFDFNTHAFTFTEDIPGAYVDPMEIYEKVGTLLDSGTASAEVTIVPEKLLADMTRIELMNSFTKVSGFTTSTTNNSNRNTNIKLSAAAINGITVQPGEIFSFNGATGERTKAKGYKAAPAISGGATSDEIGGGVCQTSSTLFNAVARADLEIISRSPHAWPSSYIEKGMDATVNWPGLDFKFRNNTDWPVFIVASYANRKVTVEIYGMKLADGITIDLESETVKTLPQPSGTEYVINTSLKPGESKKTVTGRAGSVVETYKVYYQAGKEIRREKLCTSTYKAYQETIEYNPQ